MRTAAAALALCAGLFAAGPASAGLFDDEIARKQIAEQQKRVDELRQQNDRQHPSTVPKVKAAVFHRIQ